MVANKYIQQINALACDVAVPPPDLAVSLWRRANV
jgi:hypothetical protein